MKEIYYGQTGKKATKTVFLGRLAGCPSGFYLHLQISRLLYNNLCHRVAEQTYFIDLPVTYDA
jgi:hypothetical protein